MSIFKRAFVAMKSTLSVRDERALDRSEKYKQYLMVYYVSEK